MLESVYSHLSEPEAALVPIPIWLTECHADSLTVAPLVVHQDRFLADDAEMYPFLHLPDQHLRARSRPDHTPVAHSPRLSTAYMMSRQPVQVCC
jgi:hypothetical protein